MKQNNLPSKTMKFRPYAPEIFNACQSYIEAESMPNEDEFLIPRLKTWNQFATLARKVGLSPYVVFDILDGYSV